MAERDDGTVTIFQVRTAVAAGSQVIVDNPGVSVTAVAGEAFWIQEVNPSGRCDVDGPSPVDYRGIMVVPGAPVPGLVRGQRVRVEGEVVVIDGQTQLAQAVVTLVGAPGVPYNAHCERDAVLLADDRYEGVLVRLAGSTLGTAVVETCFSAEPIAVDDRMYANTTWIPSWYWVTGILERQGNDFLVLPRDADDVSEGGDDVCL